MDNKNFVSRENINNIYSFVCSKVTDVDLNSDKNNKKIVKKLVKTIFNKYSNYTFDQLNQQAVEQIVPFMINHVKSKNIPQSSTNVQNINNLLSNLSNDYESDSNMNMNNMGMNNMNMNNMNMNNKISKNPGDEKMSNASFANALDEKNKERSYDRFISDSNKFRSDLDTANKLQKEKLSDLNERGVDNNFFKNLDKVNKPDDFSLAYASRPDLFNVLNESNNIDRNLPQIANEIKIKVVDHSNANEIGSFDPAIKPPDLIEETYGGEAALPIPTLYQNTRTGSERVMNTIIILDTGTFNSANDGTTTPKESLNTITDSIENVVVRNNGSNPWHQIRINIGGNFNVDKISDVFLKRFTMIGPASPQNCQNFVFQIDELNNRSESNNNNLKNRFIIPNTTSQTLTRTSLTFSAAAGTIGTTTAINVSSDPTATIYPGDDVYANNVFVGTVTVTADASLTFGGGTKAVIASGDRIMIGTVDNILNTGGGEDNYITTINPKIINTFNIKLFNQDGNHTDSAAANNNTFAVANSVSNRFILELEFRNREIDRNIDFVNPNIATN